MRPLYSFYHSRLRPTSLRWDGASESKQWAQTQVYDHPGNGIHVESCHTPALDDAADEL